MDAMEFFQRSAGRWRSQRAVHHLPFRRAELGESEIQVDALAADDPEVLALCEFHQIDSHLVSGGCRVSWAGNLDWDREEENHEGKTVFVLVPDTDNPRSGRLMRDRGYAEIVPVVGHYEMDAEGGLVLTTEYETMSSIERFWFVNPNLRLRSSTVKRFGGFSTASFCAEMRVNAPEATASEPIAETAQTATQTVNETYLSPLGW